MSQTRLVNFVQDGLIDGQSNPFYPLYFCIFPQFRL